MSGSISGRKTQNDSVWILEDDQDCQFVYSEILDDKYNTRYFCSISEFSSALEKGPQGRPRLILADLMLGEENFLDFLNRSSDSRLLTSPFIVVSSLDDVESLRTSFREGALDYLIKPFKKNEILVKVENILSQQSESKSDPVKGAYHIELDGETIENLTAKQYELLKLFTESEDRRISRTQILESIWGGSQVHPKTIDVHLYNLRRKLHPYGHMIRSDGGGKWSLMSCLLERN